MATTTTKRKSDDEDAPALSPRRDADKETGKRARLLLTQVNTLLNAIPPCPPVAPAFLIIDEDGTTVRYNRSFLLEDVQREVFGEQESPLMHTTTEELTGHRRLVAWNVEEAENGNDSTVCEEILDNLKLRTWGNARKALLARHDNFPLPANALDKVERLAAHVKKRRVHDKKYEDMEVDDPEFEESEMSATPELSSFESCDDDDSSNEDAEEEEEEKEEDSEQPRAPTLEDLESVIKEFFVTSDDDCLLHDMLDTLTTNKSGVVFPNGTERLEWIHELLEETHELDEGEVEYLTDIRSILTESTSQWESFKWFISERHADSPEQDESIDWDTYHVVVCDEAAKKRIEAAIKANDDHLIALIDKRLKTKTTPVS